MISEHNFWQIVEASLGNGATVGSMEQDEALVGILETKTVDELVGFQLCLLDLRTRLGAEHIHSAIRELGYTGHPDVADRLKNGIVASGRSFYYRAKDDPEFLGSLLKSNPEALRNCYYEGFSLATPAAFHELTDYKQSWDRAFQKANRELELKENGSKPERKNCHGLEP